MTTMNNEGPAAPSVHEQHQAPMPCPTGGIAMNEQKPEGSIGQSASTAGLDRKAHYRALNHGYDCKKEAHLGGGYLHDASDDAPYFVDGLAYCGRCHCWLGHAL